MNVSEGNVLALLGLGQDEVEQLELVFVGLGETNDDEEVGVEVGEVEGGNCDKAIRILSDEDNVGRALEKQLFIEPIDCQQRIIETEIPHCKYGSPSMSACRS